MREKLTELLWEYDQMRMMRMSIEECTDHLISNGVKIIVQCKHCVNYQETLGKDSGKPCGYGSCKNPCAMTGIVYDEDFCSYGERKN